jgi:3-oxoadipate enol-lactonase
MRRLKYLLGGYLLWRLFGDRNRTRTHGPQEHPLPVPGRSFFVGNVEYFVREAGLSDAPAIVLIHGWVYDSVFTFYRLVPLLTDRFRVILIDQRNYGGSSRLNEEYEIETVADEVAAVLDRLEVQDAVVMGYSMGGMVAMALARRHPGKVAGAVYAATSASRFRTPVVDTSLSLALRVGWKLSPVDGAHLSAAILRHVGAFDPRHHRWMWDQLLNREVDLNLRALRAIRRFDARKWLPTLSTPALVIIPSRDQVIPPSQQYELIGLVRNPDVLELRGARHEAIFTHAADIAEAIVRFAKQ